jgi:hypothetical protein
VVQLQQVGIPKMKFDKFISKLKQEILLQRRIIDPLGAIVASLAQYAFMKTPWSLVEGVFKAVNTDRVYSAEDLFTPRNGWHILFARGSQDFSEIFTDVVNDFPSRIFPVRGDWKSAATKLVKLPVADVGIVILDETSDLNIYFKPDEISKSDLIKFLVQEKVKRLNSNCMSLEYRVSDDGVFIELHPETLDPIPSTKANSLGEYIKSSLARGINRSMCLFGPPGTGKTTIANTIMSNLNFRVLKIKYVEPDASFFYIITEIIKMFGIEAVIINDFDQFDDSNKLLEFLEFLTKNTKLMIYTVNSLKEFLPAILRPGRVDEIIKIDALEMETVRELLGELSNRYADKVASWPIAYVNELVKRSKLVNDDHLDEVCNELNERVNSQLEALKEEENKENEDG